MYKQLERYRVLNRPIRTVKYGRCSSDEQKKNGYTIGDQLELMDDFCIEHELVCVGEYIDEGISATLEISKRKDLARLIKDAKAGKFDVIIFKCIDRFFRNVGEYYECQKQLQKAGVTWLSIEENDLDPEDDDAVFKINIYLTMAEYEARKTSKRIVFNNKNRIKNKQVVTGGQCFHFPWRVVGEKKNRHLERNSEKAHILYDLIEYFEMHQSKAGVLAYINPKYDLNISTTTLQNLLTDTLLYGEYKGVPDYVEPYITKERFDKIQETLKRNARYGKNKRIYLLSGLIICPSCGRKMVGKAGGDRGEKTALHYRCNKANIQKACPFIINISEKKLEQQLLDNLEQYINNEIVKVNSIAENPKPKTDNTKRIEAIKKEMERLTKVYRKGRIEEEEYDRDYLALEKELKTLDVEETPVECNLEPLKELLKTDYKTMYNALDRQHKKAFWRNLIKEFTVNEDRKVVAESVIFF